MRMHTLIIVENDDDEQFFMRESINQTGLFQVLAQVIEGQELFDWLESHPTSLPDIILSDLNMPGKNGYDVLTEMRNNLTFGHIPVIITSTSATKITIDKCYALGAAGFIEKPDTFVDYAPFFRRLQQLIADKQLVKE
jgi:CheY-like chemotaxis protein